MHVLLMEEVDDVMMSGDEERERERERRIMLLVQYMRSELLSQTRPGIKRKWIKKTREHDSGMKSCLTSMEENVLLLLIRGSVHQTLTAKMMISRSRSQ